MLSTLAGGLIALIIAAVFLAILVAKVPSIALWVVVLIGVVLMAVSLVEEMRSGEGQAGGSSRTKLPEGQQKRGGVS